MSKYYGIYIYEYVHEYVDFVVCINDIHWEPSTTHHPHPTKDSVESVQLTSITTKQNANVNSWDALCIVWRLFLAPPWINLTPSMCK